MLIKSGIIHLSFDKNPKYRTLEVGNKYSGDFTKISETGEVRHYGLATVWGDITNTLIARNLESTAGTIDYNFAEGSLLIQPGGNINNQADRLFFNFQIPHGAKSNSQMKLHCHWEQPNNTERIFTIQYRIQKNNQAKTTAWTTVTASTNNNSVFTYTSGTLNQITNLVAVDLVGAGISATVQFRICRTDNNAGDVNATFIDAHIEYDSNGSEQEFIKY